MVVFRQRLWRLNELVVHPVAPGLEPFLEVVNLALETAVTGGVAAPSLRVADLRLAEFVGHRIDRGVEGGRAEGAVLSQGVPAVDVLLPEIDILEEFVPPDVVMIVGAVAGAVPALGVVVAAVGRIEGPVEVPERAHLELAVAFLMDEGAQPEGIDVHRQHVEQVVIDPRIDVDIAGVAKLRIGRV